MNKVAAAVLAVAMVGSMAVPAFADDGDITGNEGNKFATTGNTDVKYQVDETYTWTIHSEIDFGANRTAQSDGSTEYDASAKTIKHGDGSTNNKVSVKHNVIPTGKTLVITAQGNNGGSATDSNSYGTFSIKTDDDAKLDYKVYSSFKKAEVAAGGEVLSVAAGTDTGETAMTFVLDTTQNPSEYAGTYKGKIIYAAKIQ